jgi:hypothetical protein
MLLRQVDQPRDFDQREFICDSKELRDIAEPSPAKSSSSEGDVPVDSVPLRSRTRATTSCGLSSVPPCTEIREYEADIMPNNQLSGNSSPYLL